MRFSLLQYLDYLNNSQPRFFIDLFDWAIDSGYAVIGTPADAIARVETLQAKQGDFGSFLLLAHNWADWAETKRSYELYARYVMNCALSGG